MARTPANRLDALQADLTVRFAHHLGYSIQMLGDIASGYDRTVDRDEFTSARCMIDAFWVHLRLLAEFLVRDPKMIKDKATGQRVPADLVPADLGVVGWPAFGPQTEATSRLADEWGVASKYVMHFGRDRIPEDPADLAPFAGGAAFRDMAANVLIVVDKFLSVFDASRPEWADGSWLPDPDDFEAFRARTLSDASGILRRAADEARGLFAASCHDVSNGDG